MAAVTESRNTSDQTRAAKGASRLDVIKKPLTAAQEIEKQTDQFMKMIIAAMKAQIPGEDSNSQSDMINMFSSMAQVKAAGEGTKLLEGIYQALSSSGMRKAELSYNRDVTYDTSTKQFNGSDQLEFQYQLKYNDSSKPPGAHISTMLSIFDSRGIRVHQAKGKTERGVHSFKWDGKNSDGKIIPEGEYNIKVEANWERIVDGVLEKTPIEAGSFISGHVDSIRFTQKGEPKLIIDGVEVDPKYVINIEDEVKNKTESKLVDYAQYIGKTVEINENEVAVNHQGLASINYKCDLERPGKVAVHILDENGNLLGISIVAGANKGVNELKFKSSSTLTLAEAEEFAESKDSKKFKPLELGKYKYKLFVQDALSLEPEKYTEVSTVRTVNITGLDFANEPLIIAGSEQFKLDSITKLSAASGSSDLFKEAVQYLGKNAQLSLSAIELKAGKAEPQFFSVAPLEPNTYYGNAYLEIFDSSGKKVARVEKPSNAIITADKNYVTLVDKDKLYDYLDKDSKYLVFDSTLYEDDDEPYATFQSGIAHEHKDETATKSDILAKLKSGVYSLDYNAIFPRFNEYNLETQEALKESVIYDYSDIVRDYEILTETDKKMVKLSIDNQQLSTGFEWDGRGLNGEMLPNGSYRYELRIEKFHTDIGRGKPVLELELVPDKQFVRITEYTSEKGELKFIGRRVNEDGNVYGSNITFSKDEITSLSA